MNYYGTPNAYPSSEIIRQADSSGTSYPRAHAQYDDNYLYIPIFTGKIVAYIKIDKHCIMDAIKHWESMEKGKSNDIKKEKEISDDE